MLYYFKARVPTFFFKLKFQFLKQFLHQPQAMFICYPTIYDMNILAFVLYMKILIEWEYPVYPDSIINLCRHVEINYVDKSTSPWQVYAIVDILDEVLRD
jgi:hypothetical protein